MLRHEFDGFRPLLYALGEGDGKSPMSIAISLVGADGIVVATDSLRTSPNPTCISQDYSQKLWLWNSTTAIMTVGANTRYSDWMTERFSKTKLNKLSNFDDIVDEFSKYAAEDLLSHTVNKDKVPDSTNIMIFVMAGYDKLGQAKIVQLDSGVPNRLFTPKLIESPYVLSYDEVAKYWLKMFDYKRWNTKVLMNMAIFLVNETIEQVAAWSEVIYN